MLLWGVLVVVIVISKILFFTHVVEAIIGVVGLAALIIDY